MPDYIRTTERGSDLHRHNQRIHALRRFEERFGLWLRGGIYDTLCQQIRVQACPPCRKRHWPVRVDDVYAIACWDYGTSQIATFIDPIARHGHAQARLRSRLGIDRTLWELEALVDTLMTCPPDDWVGELNIYILPMDGQEVGLLYHPYRQQIVTFHRPELLRRRRPTHGHSDHKAQADRADGQDEAEDTQPGRQEP